MELRVHGGPALLFPSFRDMLCWEQLLRTVNQLLGSAGLGSDLALPGRDQMREMPLRGCRSLDLLGRVAVSKHSSFVSLTGVPGGAQDGVGSGLFSVLGHWWGCEGTTGKAGRCGGSWHVCAGDFG